MRTFREYAEAHSEVAEVTVPDVGGGFSFQAVMEKLNEHASGLRETANVAVRQGGSVNPKAAALAQQVLNKVNEVGPLLVQMTQAISMPVGVSPKPGWMATPPGGSAVGKSPLPGWMK